MLRLSLNLQAASGDLGFGQCERTPAATTRRMGSREREYFTTTSVFPKRETTTVQQKGPLSNANPPTKKHTKATHITAARCENSELLGCELPLARTLASADCCSEAHDLDMKPQVRLNDYNEYTRSFPWHMTGGFGLPKAVGLVGFRIWHRKDAEAENPLGDKPPGTSLQNTGGVEGVLTEESC